MANYTFTAFIEKDSETGLYFGNVPHLQGAHTQAATLDELQKNLKEVVALCIEALSDEEKAALNFDFVGTQKVSINV